jgi:hypothetical protein
MNATPNQNPVPQSKGCLIKIILGICIIFLGALINVASGQQSNFVVTAIGGCAFLALWAWKPGQPSNSTDIEVKPLDKEKNDE